MPRPWWIQVITVLLMSIIALDAYALSFDRYHSQAEISDFLINAGKNHPEVTYYKLGTTSQGKSMEYIVLRGRDQRKKTALYLNATHHGDEWASTESLLRLTDEILLNLSSKYIQEILAQFDLILHPIVNPDGHHLKTRENSQGIDLNRDYPYPKKKSGFQYNETARVKTLLDRHPISGALALHSGMEGVLWPWAHTQEKPRHDALFRTLSRKVANAMGLRHFAQSFSDYQTTGEFIDYAYMQYGALALTLEVSNDLTPRQEKLPQITARAVAGCMTYMLTMVDLMQQNKLPLQILPWKL